LKLRKLRSTDEAARMSIAEDRKYMGSADEAKADLIAKARAWREIRQPLIAPRAEHKKRDNLEHQIRFDLANAALLWLWHQEHES
jgi:hypothetical protein